MSVILTFNRTKISTLSNQAKITKQYKCMINIRNVNLFSYPKLIVSAQKHKNNICSYRNAPLINMLNSLVNYITVFMLTFNTILENN